MNSEGRLRLKHPALVEALTGQFDGHHAELAEMLLDQIDALTAQIYRLTARIGDRPPPSRQLAPPKPAAAATAAATNPAPLPRPTGSGRRHCRRWTGLTRSSASESTAQAIIAEVGPDAGLSRRFPKIAQLRNAGQG